MPGRVGGSARYGALDGMRAFAIAGVVVYHLAPRALPSGFLGVDVFMAVSGFIVTELLLRERERIGRLRLAAFWGRRFRRLVPPLMLLVVCVVIWFRLTGPTALVPSVRTQGLAALVYMSNWRLIADGVSYGGAIGAGSPLVHLWSLAVEEQFYLVWPPILAALLFLGRGGRRFALLGAAAGAIASAVTMALLYHPGQDPLRIYYGTDTRAQAFLLGALAALASPYISRRIARIVGWLGVGALFAVAIVMVTDAPNFLYRGGFGLVGLLAAVASLATTLPGPIGWCLDRVALRGLGRVSYGVYLWHWPAIALLTPARFGWSAPAVLGARLAVTTAGTAVSWIMIERPFAGWRPRRVAWTGSIAVAAAASMLVTLPGAEVVAYANYRLDAAPRAIVSGPRTIDPQPAAFHAPTSTSPSPSTGPAWTLPAAAPGHVPTAMLVGDSGMFSAGAAFTAALERAGWRVVDTSYPGMGLTRPTDMPQVWAGDARRYHVDLTIVMIGLWDSSWAQTHGDGAYRSVVDESVRSFTAAGGKVLWLSIMRGGINPDPPTNRFYAALPARDPGVVRYLDVDPALRAPGGGFPPVVDGRRVRQTDGWHLCPDGAAALAHLVLGRVGLDRPGWDQGAWRASSRYDPRTCPAVS